MAGALEATLAAFNLILIKFILFERCSSCATVAAAMPCRVNDHEVLARRRTFEGPAVATGQNFKSELESACSGCSCRSSTAPKHAPPGRHPPPYPEERPQRPRRRLRGSSSNESGTKKTAE